MLFDDYEIFFRIWNFYLNRLKYKYPCDYFYKSYKCNTLKAYTFKDNNCTRLYSIEQKLKT